MTCDQILMGSQLSLSACSRSRRFRVATDETALTETLDVVSVCCVDYRQIAWRETQISIISNIRSSSSSSNSNNNRQKVMSKRRQTWQMINVCHATIVTVKLGPNSTTRTPATNTTNGNHQRTSSQQFYNLLYNKFTTNGQKFATSQHLDMSRCWALVLRCGKFVVELLWACPLVVLLYNMSVAGVRVVKFGP